MVRRMKLEAHMEQRYSTVSYEAFRWKKSETTGNGLLHGTRTDNGNVCLEVDTFFLTEIKSYFLVSRGADTTRNKSMR